MTPSRSSKGKDDAKVLLVLAEQTVKALTELDERFAYFQKELQDDSEGMPAVYMLDWDVIQTFIEFRLSRSAYAVSIIRGLSEAARDKIRFIVPPGSRMEFAYYVGAKTRSLMRAPVSADELAESTEGLYEDSANRPQQKRLLESRDYSEALLMLDKFARDYAIPLLARRQQDGEFTCMNMRELMATVEFARARREIERLRKEARRRNDADAANLSVLDIANSQNLPYHLVTGTQIVGQLRPNFIIDPLMFLLKFHVAPPVSGSAKRKVALNRLRGMRSRIWDLLDGSNKLVGAAHTEVVSSKTFIKSKHLRNWTRYLQDLREDPVVGDVIQLVTCAELDFKSRLSLLERDLQEEITKPTAPSVVDLGRNAARLGRLLSTMYGDEDPAEDFGYQWGKSDAVDDCIVRQLTNGNGSSIMSFAVSQTYFCVTWHTFADLAQFLGLVSEGLAKQWLTLTRNSTLKLLYRDRPPRHIGLSEEGIAAFRQNERRLRIDGVRALCKGFQVCYDPGDDTCSRRPEVTVIGDLDQVETGYRFFASTYVDYVPKTTVAAQIKDLSSYVTKGGPVKSDES